MAGRLPHLSCPDVRESLTVCLTVVIVQSFVNRVPSKEAESRMNTEPNADRWYALQLRSRWESSTAALLSCKGYQTFLPIYKTSKRGGGRSKEVQSPLFPGYLFCRFNVCD